MVCKRRQFQRNIDFFNDTVLYLIWIIVGDNILTRLKRDQYIAMESIEKICATLDYGVDDILDFVD
ncbi:MAG: helix-turn-helix domain-containing protein [Butyrivibrio sp.]|nr:helix-turn-helix domain-containing protein [Butyrivibrio sp.]